jgi:hypothetical protein
MAQMADVPSLIEFNIEFRSRATDDIIIEQYDPAGNVSIKKLRPNNRFIYKAHLGELITLKRKNVVVHDPTITGEMGGRCTCPDGEVILAGAVPDFETGEACGDLACDMATKKDLDCYSNVISVDPDEMLDNGGQCTCPDGYRYKIAALRLNENTLACIGGESGESGVYL